MQFELTDALADQIVFAMEDQNGEFLLDARKGTIVEADSVDEADKSAETEEADVFYPIPDWQPSDGFRLMEGFAASLRNPIVRAELTGALDRGRGVFRAFKDVLTGHPEVERLWFAYKEKSMRQEVIDWYNSLRETWGLERIGEEPEDTEDLVLEDFRFRAAEFSDEEVARELHELCTPGAEYSVLPLIAENRLALVAETSRGELAAVAVSFRCGDEEKAIVLDVRPEYRGLGVGEKLLDRLIESIIRFGARSISIDLPVSADSFSHVLYREGFAPYETRYRLDLDRRRQEDS
ncbi:MAG: UPF0158 family protein [Treponemataceae bacterium]